MAVTREEVNVNKMYGQECILKKEEFMEKYHVKENGLTSSEAQEKINKYGFNEIRKAKPKRWYNYFFESLFSPFNCILLGIVLILIYTDIYLPETPSYANILVIAILVITSTFLDFFEEYRSNKAAQALQSIVAITANVLRDNKEVKIPVKDVT